MSFSVCLCNHLTNFAILMQVVPLKVWPLVDLSEPLVLSILIFNKQTSVSSDTARLLHEHAAHLNVRSTRVVTFLWTLWNKKQKETDIVLVEAKIGWTEEDIKVHQHWSTNTYLVYSFFVGKMSTFQHFVQI